MWSFSPSTRSVAMLWRSRRAFQHAMMLAVVVAGVFYLESRHVSSNTPSPPAAGEAVPVTARRPADGCKSLSIPLAQRVRCIELILERNGIDPSTLGAAAGLVPSGDLLDRARLLAHATGDAKQGVLCAVFMMPTPENVATLKANIELQAAAESGGVTCDWAVVAYGAANADAARAALEELTSSAQRKRGVKVVYFDSPPPLRQLLAAHGHEDISFTPSTTYYPKPLLYLQLARLLASYEYVWLLDDDISLEGSQLPVALQALRCAFSPSPPALVGQLLITGGRQSYSYLNSDGWTQRRIVAAKSRFIELQAPLVDTGFFLWFLQAVVVPMMPAIAYFESDFGMDNVWCGAAGAYARQRLQYAAAYAPCNVVVAGQSIRHLDRGSSRAGLGRKMLKKKFLRDHQLILLFHKKFADWFVFGHTDSLNNFTSSAVSTNATCAT